MAEIILPTQTRPAITLSPKRLVIYSAPKVGKSSLLTGLENALTIDLEDGTDSVPNIMVLKAKDYFDIYDICKKVKEAGNPYRYIALDTATALESMVMPLALKLYQSTPMGKAYRDHILNLPNGSGYWYVRQAYEMMLDEVKGACERLIIFGHLKDKLIEKQGKEVSAKEIDLTGRLKTITCAYSDAIGYLYRQGNQNIITFQTTEEVACGARPTHLRNQTFPLSELNGEELTTYWNKIFID